MRVVLFTEWFLPIRGGVSSHVEGLSKELERRGHDVTIFTKKVRRVKRKDERISKGIRVVRINPALPFNFPLMPPARDEIERFLEGESFDIAHSHHAFTAMPLVGLSLANQIGIPSVVTNHSIPGGWYEMSSVWPSASSLLQPIRYYLSLADEVIAVSHAAADFISLFVDYSPIKVIPNAIDTSKFKPDPRKDSDGKRILFVSRLVQRKGPDVLLRAFRTVLKSEPDAKLTFVGSGYMRNDLEISAYDFMIEKNVEFLGDVSSEELPSIYANADIFVLPSLYAESFGIVLLEAMSSGLPVISSETGGVPEVVDDGIEGILVKPGNETELAHAMLRLLQNGDQRVRMGANARKKAVGKFDWKIVGGMIEETYESLLR